MARSPVTTKTAAKTGPRAQQYTVSPITGARMPVGAHPGNTGGKKGRSGRKPDAWRAELQRIVSSDQVLEALERVLADSSHPAYIGALKYAADHGYGRARESIEVSGPGGGAVVVQYVHESKKRTAS